MKIRRKFLLVVIPIVLAPLVILWAAFQLALTPVLHDAETVQSNVSELSNLAQTARTEARNRFENATRQAYSFGLANIGASLDGQLDSIEKSLLISADRSDLKAALANPDDQEASASVISYFRSLISTHKLLRCTLIDTTGRPILALQRVTNSSGQDDLVKPMPLRTRRQILSKDWFVKVLRADQPTSWHLYPLNDDINKSTVPVVSSAITINSAEGTSAAGYLQLALPVETLAKVIYGPAELTSSIRLVGADGVTYWRSVIEAQDQGDEYIYISQAIRGGLLNAEVAIPKASVIANLAPFDNVSQAMAESLEQIDSHNTDLRRTINEMNTTVLATKVLLAIVAFSLIWLLLSRIASRIEYLNQAALRIHDGDLQTPTKIDKARDELGTLGNSIDEMRIRIKAQIEKLDRLVEERTRELATANAQLELEITERRKAEDSALDASNAKSEFLATMSHEIRTPLNGILGGINLLSHSELDEDQKTLCSIVASSTETLNSLVNEILDLAKIEARRTEFEIKPFNVSNALHDVCENFRFRAMEKNIQLRFEDRLEDSLFRFGDPNRFKQIVYNLVGNAVKFTKEGRVVVTLEQSLKEEDAVRISVQDTGIGMSPEQVAKIFKPFTQAKSSISENFGGTGLGLAISSRLAEQMHGEITVTSQLDKGSTFILEIQLPLALSDDPKVTPEKPAKPEEPATGEILIAEDNQSNRIILNRILSGAGFTVTTVANGQECVEAVKKKRFDLILMDCSMPILDGCSATEIIRNQDSAHNQTAILGLTAHASVAQKKRCIAAGMNDVLFKPLSGPILVESCKRLASKA